MTRLALILCLSLLPGPVLAWTLLEGLWRPPPPPEPPTEVQQRLQDMRDKGCSGAADPAANAFAETSFGRGEKDKAALPQAVQAAITAIFVADTQSAVDVLAAPFLAAPDANSAAAVRIAVVYAMLRLRDAQNAGVGADVTRLLGTPDTLESYSDTHYLRAALALERRAFGAAGQHADAALAIAPDYYNARVIAGLARLVEVPQLVAAGACEQALATVTFAVQPLFGNGACALHVGHFELAAQRYIPQPNSAPGNEAAVMRQSVLAFIAGRSQSVPAILAAAPTPLRCVQSLKAAIGQEGD